jgi:hypothetical protein
LSKGADIRPDGRIVYPKENEAADVFLNPRDMPVPLCHHEELAYRENERRAAKSDGPASG